ncbi:MAG: hypothetical protein K0R31_797 [Clostridiales bacterium]|jgi:hypothetical protein|nr:hypothetical protein [Clostridiales bacterium]
MLKYVIEHVFTADPTAKFVIIGTHNAADSFRPALNKSVNGKSNLGDYILPWEK